MKGIVLAGGSAPASTRSEGDQQDLLPIYNKPMIYYPSRRGGSGDPGHHVVTGRQKRRGLPALTGKRQGVRPQPLELHLPEGKEGSQPPSRWRSTSPTGQPIA